MGAGKWRDQYSDTLKGKDVILIPDNDQVGREHMHQVAKSLQGKAKTIKYLKLHGLPPKGDVSDYLASFGDDRHGAGEALAMRIDQAPEYQAHNIPDSGQNAAPTGSNQGMPPEGQRSYYKTDIGNAMRLVDSFGQYIRYCYPFNKWFVWDGRRWNDNCDGQLQRFCKDTVRQIYIEAIALQDDSLHKAAVKHALSSQSDVRIKAMISTAQSEPGIPVMPDELDKNPYLFNTLSGTINLKTGQLQPHNPLDLITKITPFDYDPSCNCPEWMAHLDKITGGNQDLIRYMQKAFGYSMTGDTSERKIFIMWGAGKNGKSITIDVINITLGEYSKKTPIESIMMKFGDRIPNDLARLMGARFVYCSETESGRRLAESQVKDISGGEKITARFMRGEWFEFYPEFKIWLGTNHKPVITGTDNAIWDRIRLIPFTVRINDEEQRSKTELMNAFREEMPGILGWLVQGCLLWQSEGLGSSEEVEKATNEYRGEMDIIGDFIKESCVVDTSATVTVKDLYAGYVAYAEDNGEKPITKKALNSRMSERGFDTYHATGNIKKYLGISLK